MIKTTLAAALLALAFSAAPSFADDMMKAACDATTMQALGTTMGKVTDPKMMDAVKAAGDQMKMAMESMAANKMDDCTKHVGMAMDSMMIKHN